MKYRYLSNTLSDFSQDKFVLISGPRQCGKTTLAKNWLHNEQGLYLNYDSAVDRKKILSLDFQKELQDLTVRQQIVFDEIHKYQKWKTYLKGLYDTNKQNLSVVVTGSARLDVYRKSSDSMLGRYELLRLHPYSIGELCSSSIKEPPKDWIELGSNESKNKPPKNLLSEIDQFGGFPEPFEKQSKLKHQRWMKRRRDLIVNEDIRDLTNIKHLKLVEVLAQLLPEKVGSLLSLNSLREDLSVSHETISLWVDTLDYLYYSFRIAPYSGKISRSIRKENKLYLLDWSAIEDEAARFENLIASHLLKSVHLWTDLGYGEYNLHYWRNKDGKEVDFILTNKNKPVVFIEAKLNDLEPSDALRIIGAHFPETPKIQLVKKQGVNRLVRPDVRVISADRFLSELN